ncbi:MAG: mechanosensitive ion channel [Bacilli bacterium]|nr:mechanosensitive ion channel [Bacilli bacterium]
MIKELNNIITSKQFYLPLVYIFVGIIIYYIFYFITKKINNINNKVDGKIISKGNLKRKNTLIGLINNIIKYIIAVIVIINILNVYKVNTDKIIASLGIASFVIGLAFQDIIKDFLAGIFIVFDNTYSVGDWITVDNFKGEVISMGLKTTKIKANTGEVMILANSTLTKVINYNLSNPKIYLKVPFSYEEKIDKVENVLGSIIEDIKKEEYVKEANLLGVDGFESSNIDYALEVICSPNKQYQIKRILLRKIKVAFDENNIVIPFNQIDVHIDK